MDKVKPWAKAMWPRSNSLPELATSLTVLTAVTAAGAGCLAMGAFVLSALVFIGAWILFFSCIISGFVLIGVACASGFIGGGAACSAAGLWWLHLCVRAGSAVLQRLSPSLHQRLCQSCRGILTLLGLPLSLHAPLAAVTNPMKPAVTGQMAEAIKLKQSPPTSPAHKDETLVMAPEDEVKNGLEGTRWAGNGLYEEEGRQTAALPLSAGHLGTSNGNGCGLPEGARLHDGVSAAAAPAAVRVVGAAPLTALQPSPVPAAPAAHTTASLSPAATAAGAAAQCLPPGAFRGEEGQRPGSVSMSGQAASQEGPLSPPDAHPTRARDTDGTRLTADVVKQAAHGSKNDSKTGSMMGSDVDEGVSDVPSQASGKSSRAKAKARYKANKRKQLAGGAQPQAL